MDFTAPDLKMTPLLSITSQLNLNIFDIFICLYPINKCIIDQSCSRYIQSYIQSYINHTSIIHYVLILTQCNVIQGQTLVQGQKAVSAYFTSGQILPFGFARQNSSKCLPQK